MLWRPTMFHTWHLFLVENNKGSLILTFILTLNGNLHKKWMWRHGQTIRTSDAAVRWEEDDNGLPKRLAIEPSFWLEESFFSDKKCRYAGRDWLRTMNVRKFTIWPYGNGESESRYVNDNEKVKLKTCVTSSLTKF